MTRAIHTRPTGALVSVETECGRRGLDGVTCTESSSMGGASLLHLLDEDCVHWLQPVPLSPWQRHSTTHIKVTQRKSHCGIRSGPLE